MWEKVHWYILVKTHTKHYRKLSKHIWWLKTVKLCAKEIYRERASDAIGLVNKKMSTFLFLAWYYYVHFHYALLNSILEMNSFLPYMVGLWTYVFWGQIWSTVWKREKHTKSLTHKLYNNYFISVSTGSSSVIRFGKRIFTNSCL